jgi:aspartyl protease family protein
MSGLTNLVFFVLIGSVASVGVITHLQKDSASQPPKSLNVMVQPVTATVAPSGGNTAMLYADTRGHFHADVYIRGIPVRTLVDTGASLVSFSREDAAKFGLRDEPNQKKAQFNTANGLVSASIVRIPEMRLQGITVYDVEAAIMPKGAMNGTLLGMSFMKKLQSYESRGTSMVLRK